MRSWNHEWVRSIKEIEKAVDVPSLVYQLSDMVLGLYDNDLYPREYHNSNHILTGIDLLDEYEVETRTPLMPPVRFSWMMHDARCVPGASDNEVCSAFLACTIIGNDLPNDPILSTKPTHQGSTIAGRIIRDVDWSYFGLPYEEFVHITDTIRKEYQHLSDEEWKAGRKTFLESVNPENVFWTSHFKKKYQEQSKKNIEQSIVHLS